jgi:hypothetical protein
MINPIIFTHTRMHTRCLLATAHGTLICAEQRCWWPQAELSLEDRMRYTMSHAGPSIVIASATDVAAFLTAAFTPIPAITYFCVTVAFSLIIGKLSALIRIQSDPAV